MKKRFILYRFELDDLNEKSMIHYLREGAGRRKRHTAHLSEARKVNLLTALFFTVFMGYSFVSEKFARNMH